MHDLPLQSSPPPPSSLASIKLANPGSPGKWPLKRRENQIYHVPHQDGQLLRYLLPLQQVCNTNDLDCHHSDARRINVLHQWCVRMLLSIKCYHFNSNDTVRRQINQPLLTKTIQALCLTLFGDIAQMDDNVDAKQILTSSPLVYWKRPPGRPQMTWMKTVQNDLDSHGLSLLLLLLLLLTMY